MGVTASNAFSMQPLDEAVLSSISGKDGISIDIETPSSGITADSLSLKLDPELPTEALLQMASSVVDEPAIKLVNVDANGNVGGSAFVVNTFDVGSDGSSPYLSYQLEIFGQPDSDGARRARLALGELGHGEDNAYGSWALDGEGELHFINEGGIFNAAGNNAYLLGELSNGRIYYRQVDYPEVSGDPEPAYLIMDNLKARWEMAQGALGINNEGIRMATDGTINVALDTDLFFKTGGDDFTPGGRGLQHFGWLGSLKEAELLWRTKGASADPSQTPGAINLSSRWNYIGASEGSYNEEFRWRLGETGGTSNPANGDTRIMFEVADWATWGNNTYGHDFPLIALDVISGDRIGPNQNQLCWGYANGGGCSGGDWVNLEPGFMVDPPGAGASEDNKGLALTIRDGNLMSYSRRINLLEQEWNSGSNSYETILDPAYEYADPEGNVTHTIDWGLIYTFANVDGNIYLYPGGNPDDDTKGILADIVLMSQTFCDPSAGGGCDDSEELGFNWEHGSHLMIADTNMDGDSVNDEGEPVTGTELRDAMGIGLIGTSFLVMADDTRIWLKPDSGDATYPGGSNYSGGLDLFSPRVRFALDTTFGGGILPADEANRDVANEPYGEGPQFVLGARIRANMEGAVNMRLSPSRDADPAAKNYLGYSWAVRLKDTGNGGGEDTGFGDSQYGSFISFAEPSRPSVALRLANITGDLSITNGKIDVRGATEDGDNNPKLVISHDMQLGLAASDRVAEGLPGVGAGNGPEFKIDNLMLGEATLGRIVMPSARIHSSLTLEPPQ